MSVLFTVLVAAALPAGAASNRFVVYDAMQYGQPDTQPLGMVKLSCFDDRELRPPNQKGPGNADFLAGRLPDKAKFFALIRKQAEKRPGPIMMDFEKIFLNGKPPEAARRIQVLATMANWAQEAAPGRLVGYWGEGGCRLFPENPGDNMKRVTPLVHSVSAFFPNLYLWGGKEDRDAFRKHLTETLRIAHKIAPNKPVYPVLWPQLPGSGKGRFASGAFWKFQLETVRASGAEGVVLWGFWGHNKQNSLEGREDEPWWQETVQFMKLLQTAGERKQ